VGTLSPADSVVGITGRRLATAVHKRTTDRPVITDIATTDTRTPTVQRSRIANAALWLTQLALAAMFLMAGASKLAGAAPMVALFDAIGLGQWFRYVTGVIETGSAVALLIPSAAPFGALLLIPTMIGAAATNLFLGQSPVVPVVLLLGAAAVAWTRRRQLQDAYSRLKRNP
jgi:putative oxidoreductase